MKFGLRNFNIINNNSKTVLRLILITACIAVSYAAAYGKDYALCLYLGEGEPETLMKVTPELSVNISNKEISLSCNDKTELYSILDVSRFTYREYTDSGIDCVMQNPLVSFSSVGFAITLAGEHSLRIADLKGVVLYDGIFRDSTNMGLDIIKGHAIVVISIDGLTALKLKSA